jgi:hypothetical protein
MSAPFASSLKQVGLKFFNVIMAAEKSSILNTDIKKKESLSDDDYGGNLIT